MYLALQNYHFLVIVWPYPLLVVGPLLLESDSNYLLQKMRPYSLNNYPHHKDEDH